MKSASALMLVGILTALIPSQASAVRITHQSPRFQFELPPGFEEFPDAKSAMPDLWRAFRKPAGENYFALGVEVLAGTIGRESMKLAQVKQAAEAKAGGLAVKVSEQSWKWRQFDLQVVVSTVGTESDGGPITTYSVQVPLTPRAIQLTFAAPEKHQRELATLFHSVLDSVEGDTNWLSNAERAEKLGRGIGLVLVFAGAMAYLFHMKRKKG